MKTTKLISGIFISVIFGVSISTAAIHVDVIKNEDASWQVSYSLPHAVHQVYFYRQSNLNRDNWEFNDPKLNIKLGADSHQLIDANDGSEFSEFSVRIPSNYIKPLDDYALNVSFGDSGDLLYTGHLVLSLQVNTEIPHQMTFNVNDKNNLIINGSTSQGKVKITDIDSMGSYVYFGQDQPIETNNMLAVLDKELPNWIQVQLRDNLPQIFQIYAQKLSKPLTSKPVVFFSYNNMSSPGNNYSGGVLPDQIQLQISGKGWKNKSPNNQNKLLEFLAHEAAHLWNFQSIKTDQNNYAAWLHEGSAEWFAIAVLTEMGLYTSKDAAKAHEKSLNECINLLGDQALNDFMHSGPFEINYRCGAIIALFTDLALKQSAKNTDLFDFWAQLLINTKQNDTALGVKSYLNLLSKLTNDDKYSSHLKAILEEPHEDSFGFFKDIFATVNLPLEAIKYHPSQSSSNLQKALIHLMLIDCGTYSFTHHSTYLRVGDHLQCDNLKASMEIAKITGLSVESAGNAIHAQVMASCAKNKSIEITSPKNQTVKISCNQPLSDAQPWLQLKQLK